MNGRQPVVRVDCNLDEREHGLLVQFPRTQELCESRGGRPGLPSLISLRFLWT